MQKTRLTPSDVWDGLQESSLPAHPRLPLDPCSCCLFSTATDPPICILSLDGTPAAPQVAHSLPYANSTQKTGEGNASQACRIGAFLCGASLPCASLQECCFKYLNFLLFCIKLPYAYWHALLLLRYALQYVAGKENGMINFCKNRRFCDNVCDPRSLMGWFFQRKVADSSCIFSADMLYYRNVIQGTPLWRNRQTQGTLSMRARGKETPARMLPNSVKPLGKRATPSQAARAEGVETRRQLPKSAQADMAKA